MLGKQKIGLIAGWGRFPVVVAEALTAQGHDVYCLFIRDHADPALRTICHDCLEVGLAQLGRSLRYFQQHGVREATLAGKVFKVRLFERGAWRKLIPDWQSLRVFFHHFITKRRDHRDDSLLLAIVHAFGEAGVSLVPATQFAPELLVKFGQLSGRRLSRAQQQDIAFGWHMAKEMGRLDIGQSVAVKGQAVLAVEAVEGTDACIRRAGELCTSGGFTVVKVAKPQQDMRFDVPTIGLGTLETLVRAGGRVLAVEAEKTILLDEPSVIEYARNQGLTLVAITPERLCELGEREEAAA